MSANVLRPKQGLDQINANTAGERTEARQARSMRAVAHQPRGTRRLRGRCFKSADKGDLLRSSRNDRSIAHTRPDACTARCAAHISRWMRAVERPLRPQY